MIDDGAMSEMDHRLLDILVLMGGPSNEREISLLSGAAVAHALASCGHRVRRDDIHPLHTQALDDVAADVVFIALHGEFGEDGQVQQLCEERELTYVGSPPHASELAMDKAASKQVYRKIGLATPDWVVIEEFDRAAKQAEVLPKVGLPCVLKPVDGGSSVDISIANTVEQRSDALEYLLDKYSRAMVERYVVGREFTVSVLGDSALPAMEIRVQRGFYDYIAKYDDDGGTEYISEHGLDGETIGLLQMAALNAHRALGCRDMSRSDFRLGPGGRVWILETNTIPGFTNHSLLPKAAAVAGIDFAGLCDRLVQMAVDRKDVTAGSMSGGAERR